MAATTAPASFATGAPLAGIASMKGSTLLEPSRYAPSERGNILHIHTTDDPVVPYGGGFVNIDGIPKMLPFPGAVESVQMWAGSSVR